MIKEFWKQLEVSAIVFASKFKNNLFLRAQVTFAAFIAIMCILIVASIAITAHYVAEDTFSLIFSTWGSALIEAIPSPAFTIQELNTEIGHIKSYYLLLLGFASISIIVALGVIASKLSLSPTREAINAQRNFIGHTAHELRTPLSIARTNVEATLLSKDKIDKAACIRELQRTLIELDTLAGIINNLVALNTLMNLEPAEYHYYDLLKIIDEVVDLSQELLLRKNIKVTITQDGPNYNIWGNKNALKQMISNVLGNAINFSDPHSTITVMLHQHSPRYMRLIIRDTGIGIAKEDLPYIFKPFYRSAAARVKENTGSGLGLSIVRELVRLHLGRISYESTEGIGTTVTIDLPIMKYNVSSKTDMPTQENKVTFNFGSGKE